MQPVHRRDDLPAALFRSHLGVAEPVKRHRGKRCGYTGRDEALVELEEGEVDRQDGFRPRFNLTLEHVAVQIHQARHKRQTAAVDVSDVGDRRLAFDDVDDVSAFDPDRTTLNDPIGQHESKIAEPHTASSVRAGCDGNVASQCVDGNVTHPSRTTIRLDY